MLDITLESISAVVLVYALFILLRTGKQNKEIRQSGWNYLIAGFGLLWLANIIAITDDFQSLDMYIVIGDISAQAFLEKIVGYLCGILLLITGLIKWVPAITCGKINNHLTKQLKKELFERKRNEEVDKILLDISNAVNTTPNLQNLFLSIHNSLKNIIDATNFFIAIVDVKKRTLDFPYFVDTVDDNYYPITDFDINNSLTGLVVTEKKPVLLKKKELMILEKKKHIHGLVPLIWMGVPLIVKDEVIGIVAVQSYTDPDLYRQQDLAILTCVSTQIGLAIERKRADEQIQTSEKRFREIIEGVSEISIQGYDEQRRVIFWNSASEKLYGYNQNEVFGKKLEDIIIPENMKEQTETLHNRWINNGEQIPAGKLTLIDKNGDDVPVFSSHVLHETPNGKEMYCFDIDLKPLNQALNEKINAQKIAEEQKKMALVGQVAGKMAHDFNNILGIIMGNAELAIMDCKDDETKKIFELIFEQSLRGKNLTRNLVAFSKDHEPKQEFFRLSDKIDLVLSLIEKDLKGIALIHNEGSDIPSLLADPGMIEHTLLNLLQNSIHAVSLVENPRILIKTYTLNNKIVFEIEDNGCGIEKKHIVRIYEPSFSLKGSKDVTGSYKPGIKGTGYGLANIKKYIEQHKGSISIKSEFGEGTKITITMPVVKNELKTIVKTDTNEELSFVEKNILLVEDERAISDIQCRILTQDPGNHKVDAAYDGQAAMDLFDKNEYDFISLDYILPGTINGMDVYNYIRKTNKMVPIMFNSGNIEFLESIKDLKDKDAYLDHLSKPCQKKDYLNGVNGLLKKKMAG